MRAQGPNISQTMKPQQTDPIKYTVYPVSTDIMLPCGLLCSRALHCIPTDSSSTQKGCEIKMISCIPKTTTICCWKGAMWDAKQMRMSHIEAVIIDLIWSLGLVFVSTSPYTIMPVPPILMAPRGPSSPTLISCSLWKKWRRTFRSKLCLSTNLQRIDYCITLTQ